MPATELMTWVHARRRWTRMYKDRSGVQKRYWISCKALGLPKDQWTREGSYQAANAWWRAKQLEIDAASRPIPRPRIPMEDLAAAYAGDSTAFESQLKVLNIVFAHHMQQALRRLQEEQQGEEDVDDDGQPATVINLEELAQRPATDADRQAALNVTLEKLAQLLVTNQPLPEQMAQLLPPARLQQLEDGRAAIRGEATIPEERTVAAYCDRWLKLQHAKVTSGELAPDRADNLRIQLQYFRDFLGGTSAAEGVDAAKLEAYYHWCRQRMKAVPAEAIADDHRTQQPKKTWSAVYAQKVFKTACVFVRCLWSLGVIELPRNIDSPEFRFKVSAKKLEVWTADEFLRALAGATGQLRLHLLLMANCGFTQEDISDLLQSEVEWKQGRIIRRRSKTGDHENVPTVNYKLWPTTFTLLQEYRSDQERVLLTESGKPWKWKELVNGKLRKSDNIASCYAHLKAKLKGFQKSLKGLRKTGATLLDSDPTHRHYSTLFLGQSARSIKDRHYSVPDQDGFDEAVLWLGQQLGQVPVKEAAEKTKGRGKGKKAQ